MGMRNIFARLPARDSLLTSAADGTVDGCITIDSTSCNLLARTSSVANIAQYDLEMCVSKIGQMVLLFSPAKYFR